MSVNPTGKVFFKKITYSSAMILAGTTQQIIVPAPGVGKILMLAGPFVVNYTYGGTAYTGGGSLIIGTDTVLTGTSYQGILSVRCVQGTTTPKINMGNATPIASATTDINSLANKALVSVFNSTAPTGGNGTFDLIVPYYVITL